MIGKKKWGKHEDITSEILDNLRKIKEWKDYPFNEDFKIAVYNFHIKATSETAQPKRLLYATQILLDVLEDCAGLEGDYKLAGINYMRNAPHYRLFPFDTVSKYSQFEKTKDSDVYGMLTEVFKNECRGIAYVDFIKKNFGEEWL